MVFKLDFNLFFKCIVTINIILMIFNLMKLFIIFILLFMFTKFNFTMEKMKNGMSLFIKLIPLVILMVILMVTLMVILMV